MDQQDIKVQVIDFLKQQMTEMGGNVGMMGTVMGILKGQGKDVMSQKALNGFLKDLVQKVSGGNGDLASIKGFIMPAIEKFDSSILGPEYSAKFEMIKKGLMTILGGQNTAQPTTGEGIENQNPRPRL